MTENQEAREDFGYGSEIWATIGPSTMHHIGTVTWDEDEAAELKRSMAEGDDTFFLIKLQESISIELEARQRADWLAMPKEARDRIEAFLADPSSGVHVSREKRERHRRITDGLLVADLEEIVPEAGVERTADTSNGICCPGIAMNGKHDHGTIAVDL